MMSSYGDAGMTVLCEIEGCRGVPSEVVEEKDEEWLKEERIRVLAESIPLCNLKTFDTINGKIKMKIDRFKELNTVISGEEEQKMDRVYSQIGTKPKDIQDGYALLKQTYQDCYPIAKANVVRMRSELQTELDNTYTDVKRINNTIVDGTDYCSNQALADLKLIRKLRLEARDLLQACLHPTS